tara:strand:+ start:383 stop:1030 length:648 start_codon:yes stop_codon:yes gene_type:complete
MKLLIENWRKFLQEEEMLTEKCWDGYKQAGMKKKGDRMVPNCVPVSGKTNEGFEDSPNHIPGGPGDAVGTIRDVGSNLYRISRRDGVVQSRNKPTDRDYYYTNRFGDVEHRIFFFSSQDEALGRLFSDIGDLSAVIGDFEKDYKISDLSITTFRSEDLPQDVIFYEDPEINNSSAIYGAYDDGRAWEVSPREGDSQVADKLITDEEDEYYYETYN